MIVIIERKIITRDSSEYLLTIDRGELVAISHASGQGGWNVELDGKIYDALTEALINEGLTAVADQLKTYGDQLFMHEQYAQPGRI